MITRGLTVVHSPRAGFSLLEVLVACGILVIGLSGIAAILPAAASRLSEATAQDRAAAIAAIAMSELECRNIASAFLFTTATTPPMTYTSGSTAVLLGEVMPTVTGTTLATLSASGSNFLRTKIDTGSGEDRRGFCLEDEVRYSPALTSTMPRNSFTYGPRDFTRGVCWGAMVMPYPWGTNPATMNAVQVSVAVFKKPGGTISLTLNRSSSGIFELASPSDESTRKKYLKPCSYVLALPASGSASPKWLAVNSSWPAWAAGSNPQTTLPTSFGTTFRGDVDPSLLVSGSTLKVIGFENLLLLTEQTFTIK